MSKVLETYPIDPKKEITTVGELRYHLGNAVAVELSTVPLYLYAAYSIQTSGYSQWESGMSAFRTIRSVVIEEMLHLCLARNLLVAIGGDAPLYPKLVPEFPADMLHRWPPLGLILAPASEELMEKVFMPLELPSRDDIMIGALQTAEPEYEPMQYRTLGEFYAAIEQGFTTLCAPGSPPEELWGDEEEQKKRKALQYGRAYWNQDGGGSPIVVTDLESAKNAINTIVDQGEGADGDTVPLNPANPKVGHDEPTHYAKFRDIAKGIDKIGEVWPVPTNPKAEDYPEGPLRQLATLFDAAYCYTLCLLDKLYVTPTITRDLDNDGNVIAKEAIVSPRYQLERTFLAAMGGLLYPIADLLVRQPVTPKHATTSPDDGPRAAPCFGFYGFSMEKGTKKEELTALCDAVLGAYPSLGGDDGVRQLINRLPPVD